MQNELQDAVAEDYAREFLAAMREELGVEAQRRCDPGDEDEDAQQRRVKLSGLDPSPFVAYTFSVRSTGNDGEQPMLTAKQRELLLFIDGRLKQDGVSPSFDEMREALDLKSKSGVHRLISALEERGFIRRLPNRARALEVVKLPETSPGQPPSRRSGLRSGGGERHDGNPASRQDRGWHADRGAAGNRERSRFRRRCSARASIMRSRSRAIRWSRKGFSTAISR